MRLKCDRHGTVRGYFDDLDAAEAALADLDASGVAGEGTYITLNPLASALLARAYNRFEDRAATRAADQDVVYRLWLPIDVDPVRPAGISSTDAELATALECRDAIVAWLQTEFGFPNPVLLMSGNGGHALFSIEEPNDADTTAMVKSILTVLDAKFSNDKVRVDTSVHNSARIWTLPGSTKRKGEDRPDRPHRAASITSSPWREDVSREQLQWVADFDTSKKKRRPKALRSTRRSSGVLDMQAEFAERGWYERELSGGKHAVKCPWSEEHSGQSGITETVIFEPEEEGAVWGFRCQHSHCAERSIKDVWEMFRPEEDDPPQPEEAAGNHISVEDFAYVAPQDKFLCLPTRELWVRIAVDTRLPMKPKASEQIARARSVEQMSWLPGQGVFVDDCVVSEGGVTTQPGYRIANLYRGPERPEGGNADEIDLWMEHLTTLYPHTFDHIINWCAHRIQRPFEKVNHALVLGGKQGIGKDTLLEPLKQGVGPWNFSEIHPGALMGEFNGYLRSIVLRINEARDLGEANRYELYERSKTVTTGPPDTLRINEKHTKEYHVPNVAGVIFTTNHRDGLWLPQDDRRHHVSWCEDKDKDDFNRDYWEALWNWYRLGGLANVIAFFESRDISDFDAKNPPPKTDAWREMVANGCAPEESDMSEVLERAGRPPIISMVDLKKISPSETYAFLNDRRNRRRVPHLMESAGYRVARSTFAKDGLWVIGGKRVVLYALETLSESERHRAVRAYTDAQEAA